MSDKTCFMKYKCLRLANRQLASDWWCSWMWGVAAPDPLKSKSMTLLGVEGEEACPGPAHSWEVRRDPPGSQLSPGG